MFIEPGDRIRFRVAEEIFEDSKPKMGGEIQDKVIPYKIIAAIDDDGLGPVSWWNWNVFMVSILEWLLEMDQNGFR